MINNITLRAQSTSFGIALIPKCSLRDWVESSGGFLLGRVLYRRETNHFEVL